MRQEPSQDALGDLHPEVVFIHDEERRIVSVSPSVRQVLGYGEEAFEALRTYELIHPDDLDAAARTAAALRAEPGASYRSVLRIRHADGHYLWCEVVGRNAFHEDVRGVVNTLRDVSDQRALRERLQHQALHDELTGLPNRRYFLEVLEGELLRTRGKGLGLLVVDPDRFKDLNERIGHAAGDELLRQCADEIARAIRSGDRLARLGGDEFAVMLTRLRDDDSLLVAAERVRGAAGWTYPLDTGAGDVTLSIGAARARVGDTSEDLLRAAEEALHGAKSNGGDRVMRSWR
ncbi:MAG: diguanylate cyclase [Myxococcota bacterium]